MLLLLIYLVILGFLSLNPWLLPDPHTAIGFITWDLVDHAIAYGLLSILLMSTFWDRERALVLTIRVVLVTSAIGILLEYSQHWFTFTRQFSLYDSLANIFGAVLGMVLFWSICIFRINVVERANKRIDIP